MTQTISFISPKTAGASSVSLNAAQLLKALEPQQKVAYVELAGWCSQAANLASAPVSTWADLCVFHKTDEWEVRLLQRGRYLLGVDIYFSPEIPAYPPFSKPLADAWFKLLMACYDWIIIDINQAAPVEWQQFYFEQSTQIIGVVAPDPVSVAAWQHWSEDFSQPLKLKWLLNQASKRSQSALLNKFRENRFPLLGVLRFEPFKFWYQVYQAFPVAWHKRSGFKTDLTKVVSLLIAR